MPYYIDKISQFLPLAIEQCLWENECFSVSGKNWLFSTSSSWRVSSQQGIEFGAESYPNSAELTSLIGLKIIGVRASGFVALDIQLVLENGKAIECFSATHFEPWELRLPDETIIVADGNAS